MARSSINAIRQENAKVAGVGISRVANRREGNDTLRTA